MKVTVKLFASAREALGKSEIEIAVPDPATVGALRVAIAERYPQLLPLVERSLFAIDANYARDEDPLADAAEVACILPVSGG